ncbi:lactate utilization protein [Poseidonocella sp. HB161398]|uniref:lactate utilization protein n=1 Tax=Poseidonocella sp. HB161398 TaxID=2320855 RepID=UPI0014861028|nr:lactate utilization protein [Poseidonocella sp. HB161398]
MAMGDIDLGKEIRQYNRERAEMVVENLKAKYMDGHFVETREEALALLLDLIPAGAKLGRGDSVTLNQLGVFEALTERGTNEFINPVRTNAQGHNPPREERRAMQRQTLLSDVYLAGTNAITLEGTIVNCDGSGNRVAAMCFGPKKVILVVGCNKIVRNVEAALDRIRDFACPVNAMRHRMKHSKDDGLGWGVMRYTTIIDGNQPVEQGKITVILVNEDLGM